MAEQLQRLPRPTSALEVQEGIQIPPSRGVNRSHLTLYLSIGAILLSLAGAGVQLFIFLAGHQQQMAAQVALDNANRELVAVQITKEKELARAARFEADLKLAQTQEARAAKVNHDQDTAKKSVETEVASQLRRKTTVEANVAVELVNPMIDQLKSGRLRSAQGNLDLLGQSTSWSPYDIVPPPLRRSGSPPPLGTLPGQVRSDPYDKYKVEN